MASLDCRGVLDRVAQAVWVVSSEDRLLFANAAGRRLLAIGDEPLDGRSLWGWIAPAARERIPSPLGSSLADREERTSAVLARLSLIQPEGAELDVELVGASRLADQDAIVLSARTVEPAATSDSGEALASRAELAEQKRRFQTILDTIPVGVILAEGPEGRLTVINPYLETIAAGPVSCATLAEFHERFPASRVDGRPYTTEDRPLSRTLHKGEPVHELVKYRKPDGKELIIDVTTAAYPGPQGGAICTYRDVTDLLRLRAELAERVSQLKALLDHAPVGVAYFDRIGVCRAINVPARKFLGRTRDEMIGATASELFMNAPELRQGLERCVRKQEPHARPGVPWPGSVDGDASRYLDWKFEPLPPADPTRPRGALALIVDVTERTLAQIELQRARDAAETASNRKTQFLSAVSHDLRTPVNALSLQAELLAVLIEGRDDPDGELHTLANDIRQVASNLIELINDLLDLTRFDSGAIDYQVSDFPLDDFLSKTLASLEVTAHKKNLEFTWRVDHAGRVIRGDRVKLGRVLVNLVGNAVKFTDSGSVAVFAGAEDSGGLVLSVRDTGPGIPEDQRQRIFDEFAQLRNPERDRTKGTGLGLAICRRLVEGVGGHLTVESKVGVGSRFTAWYPPDHLPAISLLTSESNDPSTADVPIPVFTAPILVVEDDVASRDTLRRLLLKAGYQVESAADGHDALEVLERSRPAVVLLDLMMPGIDGAEVLRQIRSRPEWKDIRVIVVTGDVMGGRTGELMALQVDGVLAKPVDFDELLGILGQFAPPPAQPLPAS